VEESGLSQRLKKQRREKQSPKKKPEIRFGEPMQHFGLAR
jgi:hypothetical protein